MRGTPYRYSGFTGGLNTRDSPYSIAPSQARDLLDVVGTVEGAVRRRSGEQLFGALPSPAGQVVTSLLPVEVTTTRTILAWSVDRFWSMLAVGGPTNITGSYVAIGGQSIQWSYVQAPAVGGQGPVWLSNGFDAPVTWTGAGNVAVWTVNATSTLPKGNIMIYANDRVWVTGIGTFGGGYTPFGGSPVSDPRSTLVFSGIGDATDFPAANTIMFDPNDGDHITGLGTIGPYLLVFKQRKTFLVYDLDTGANRRISASIGCVAPRSIVETPQGAFFLTLDRGVYKTDGQKMEPISDVIRPSLENVKADSRQRANAAYFQDHYYLSIPFALVGSPIGDRGITYDFDLGLQSWWKHSAAAYQLAVWRPSDTAVPALYSASARLGPSSGGEVTQWDFSGSGIGYDRQGTAMDAFWAGPWHAPSGQSSAPEHRRRLREIRIDASGEFTVGVGRNYETSNFTTRSVIPPTAVLTLSRILNLGVGRSFALTFTAVADPAITFQVESYALLMTDRSD